MQYAYPIKDEEEQGTAVYIICYETAKHLYITASHIRRRSANIYLTNYGVWDTAR